ncbi:unnamed protein product, partial [Lymnaea stagnalis]
RRYDLTRRSGGVVKSDSDLLPWDVNLPHGSNTLGSERLMQVTGDTPRYRRQHLHSSDQENNMVSDEEIEVFEGPVTQQGLRNTRSGERETNILFSGDKKANTDKVNRSSFKPGTTGQEKAQKTSYFDAIGRKDNEESGQWSSKSGSQDHEIKSDSDEETIIVDVISLSNRNDSETAEQSHEGHQR